MTSPGTVDPEIRQAISTRLLPSEMSAVANAAQRLGMTRAEWVRQAIQNSLAAPTAPAASESPILLAELLALRTILIDTLANANLGLTPTTILQIVRNADSRKEGQANNSLGHPGRM